ncbi:MAG: hypothetical protein ACRC1K_01185, partial [Planctomycetia bacterium]
APTVLATAPTKGPANGPASAKPAAVIAATTPRAAKVGSVVASARTPRPLPTPSSAALEPLPPPNALPALVVRGQSPDDDEVDAVRSAAVGPRDAFARVDAPSTDAAPTAEPTRQLIPIAVGRTRRAHAIPPAVATPRRTPPANAASK